MASRKCHLRKTPISKSAYLVKRLKQITGSVWVLKKSRQSFTSKEYNLLKVKGIKSSYGFKQNLPEKDFVSNLDRVAQFAVKMIGRNFLLGSFLGFLYITKFVNILFFF